MTSRSEPRTDEAIRCPLCGHAFAAGELWGAMYCPRCGKRFNPHSHMDETVAVPGPAGSTETDSGRVDPVADEPAAEPEAIEHFGDYDILNEVARGGMGVVYRARHRTLRRIVALKVLRGGDGATEEDLARFVREAKAAASLTHASIVPIHDFSVHQGRHYFTMDYIDGTPLDQQLESGPLLPNHACELIEKIAEAIDYAHGQGIIHRDLKPANIILDQNQSPMVTDFGLAVNLASDVQSQRMTRTGAVMGTIPYIPPEQAAGRVEMVDARSDVYALGALLYEMLTGRPPFTGSTQYELLRRVIHQDPPLPRSINPRIHPDAETICLKCLEKDPRRRYPTAKELAEDCARFLHGEVIHARPATPVYRLKRFAWRHRPYVAAAAAFLLLLTALWITSDRSSQLTEELEKTKVEAEQHRDKAETLALAIERKDRELNRSWRLEYESRFARGTRFAATPAEALQRRQAWIDTRRVRHDPAVGVLRLQGSEDEDTARGLVALPGTFPLEFELTFALRVPEEGGGEPLVIIDADRAFRAHDASLVLSFGPSDRPGARLHRGGALVAEAPQFVLSPAIRHVVKLSRFDGELTVDVDGTRLLTASLPVARSEETSPYLALGARGGDVLLDELRVSVLGLSRVVVTSMLELAGSLLLHHNHNLAIKLYESVVVEQNIRSREHLAALRGYARCLALVRGQRERELLSDCDRLIEQMRLTRTLEPGEPQYLKALALANTGGQRQKQQALRLLQRAERAAVPAPETLLRPGGWYGIGPFDASSVPGAQHPFPPDHDPAAARPMQGRNGPVVWQALPEPKQPGDPVYLDFSTGPITDSTFYVRRTYRCPRPTPVTIHTGSDEGLMLWVNDELLLHQAGARPLRKNSDVARVLLPAGENVILLKLTNAEGGCGFSLWVEPYARAFMGRFGRLAQLEVAMTHLRSGSIDEAMQQFRRLHATTRFGDKEVDGTLSILASRYVEELEVSGVLATTLDRVDRLLREKKHLDAAFGFLEAMRALHIHGNEDLATRYHRMALLHLEQKELYLADAAFRMAVSLAPAWPEPRIAHVHLLLRRGRDAEAIDALESTLADLPDNADLHLEAARIFLQTVDGQVRLPERAREAALRAARLRTENDPEAWRLAAEAEMAMGYLEEARASIQKAILLQETPIPADEELLRSLQELLGQPSEPFAPIETP